MGFKAVGEWQSLDEDHLFRLISASSQIVGGVLKHKVKGQDIWCEPGLVQWEPYGAARPLFERTEDHGKPLSLIPFVVCEICGDSGWINEGKWVVKDDDEGVEETEQRMRVLEAVEGDGEETVYEPAIRRDLGDKVLEEEKGADRKLYDLRGGPDVVLAPLVPDDMPNEDELEDALIAAAKGFPQDEGETAIDPELEALLAEEEEIERRGAAVTFGDVVEAAERIRVSAKPMAEAFRRAEKALAESLYDRTGENLRKKLLDEASSIVLGDRNNSYGPPHQDFQRTADMVTAMWRHKLRDDEEIEAHDVALFVMCIKLSRLQWTPEKRDNWVDIAGYAACGYEAFFMTNPEVEEK